MKSKLLELIQLKTKEIVDYAEAHEPVEVLPNNDTLTTKDAWNYYVKLINENAICQTKLKDLDLLLHTLNDAKIGLTSNTTGEARLLKQLVAYIDKLKSLRQVLLDINDQYYHALLYYEKGGGLM